MSKYKFVEVYCRYHPNAGRMDCLKVPFGYSGGLANPTYKNIVGREFNVLPNGIEVNSGNITTYNSGTTIDNLYYIPYEIYGYIE